MNFKFFNSPKREYAIIILLVFFFALSALTGFGKNIFFGVAVLGSLPTIWSAIISIKKWKINIDVFNTFALAASFLVGEEQSFAFIVLMLSFASLLDWRTSLRTHSAVEELLKLKPQKAFKETNGKIAEISIDDIKIGDILVVESGARIPADGKIIFGKAQINESSVTGESMPKEKVVGDMVLSSTLNESGALKIRVDKAGKDSTLEQMVALMKEAAKNKSRSEKYADKFAAVFLPIVALLGLGTYLITQNISMVIALFLVACADDMAVAIPLAVTAAIGQAAKRGVIVKGGEWLDMLAKTKTLILDKTGTLTYGILSVSGAYMEAGVAKEDFWRAIGIAEKFSEHPLGRALFHETVKHFEGFPGNEIPDADSFQVYKGSGVIAKRGIDEIAIGDESILEYAGISPSGYISEKISALNVSGQSRALVFVNKKFLGAITVSDKPRPEAKASVEKIKQIGIKRILMFTGDNEGIAKNTAEKLNIDEFKAAMSPEDKLKELGALEKISGPVAMVGDGINDAPVLARADVGIAMGGGGTAAAIEAADIVILTDNLARIPELIILGRRTSSIIRGDMIIWVLTNLAGFLLVFLGVFGPALAAFYNFATDFLPLINSTRLFKK